MPDGAIPRKPYEGDCRESTYERRCLHVRDAEAAASRCHAAIVTMSCGMRSRKSPLAGVPRQKVGKRRSLCAASLEASPAGPNPTQANREERRERSDFKPDRMGIIDTWRGGRLVGPAWSGLPLHVNRGRADRPRSRVGNRRDKTQTPMHEPWDTLCAFLCRGNLGGRANLIP